MSHLFSGNLAVQYGVVGCFYAAVKYSMLINKTLLAYHWRIAKSLHSVSNGVMVTFSGENLVFMPNCRCDYHTCCPWIFISGRLNRLSRAVLVCCYWCRNYCGQWHVGIACSRNGHKQSYQQIHHQGSWWSGHNRSMTRF